MSEFLAIGMTCAPRAPAGTPLPYTHRAVMSLRAAGFTEQLHLFCEPGNIRVPNSKQHNFTVRRNPTQLGVFPNWRQGLEWLLSEVTADWYLMLQDDVIWRTDGYRQFCDASRREDLADVGFLSPYTSPAMVPDARAAGWVEARFHKNAFWGALALAMPRQQAMDLVAYPRFVSHTSSRALDVVVGNCFRDMGQRTMVHVPSLCDHIGTKSSIGRDKIPGNRWGRRGYKWKAKP